MSFTTIRLICLAIGKSHLWRWLLDNCSVPTTYSDHIIHRYSIIFLLMDNPIDRPSRCYILMLKWPSHQLLLLFRSTFAFGTIDTGLQREAFRRTDRLRIINTFDRYWLLVCRTSNCVYLRLSINIWSVIFNNLWNTLIGSLTGDGRLCRIIVLIFSCYVALLLLVQAYHNFHVAKSDEDLADVERYLALNCLDRKPRKWRKLDHYVGT